VWIPNILYSRLKRKGHSTQRDFAFPILHRLRATCAARQKKAKGRERGEERGPEMIVRPFTVLNQNIDPQLAIFTADYNQINHFRDAENSTFLMNHIQHRWAALHKYKIANIFQASGFLSSKRSTLDSPFLFLASAPLKHLVSTLASMKAIVTLASVLSIALCVTAIPADASHLQKREVCMLACNDGCGTCNSQSCMGGCQLGWYEASRLFS